MQCRMCGICCVAVSINSPQLQKAAGVRCPHLTDQNTCGVWGDVERQPSVCRTIKPSEDLCFPGLKARDHYKALVRMERVTRP
jgi:hypothetical protein